MPARTNKRGLMAPPHAAALNALDFAHAHEAFRRALAVGATAKTEEDVDATGDVIAQACDHLLSIPATTPAEIAVKVEAYAWLNTVSSDMADPANQHRIAAGNDDKAKGLLAIYLDLTGLVSPAAPIVASPAFTSAREDYEAAEANEAEAFRIERESDVSLSNEELDSLYATRHDALWTAMLVPSPDLDALAWKLAMGINIAHAEFTGESANDPATISRLLAEKAWDGGCIPAVAYQDVLRLAGRQGPLTEAKPDTFDAATFLANLMRDCGAAVLLTRDGTPAIQTQSRRKGPSDIVAASARWDGLSNAHQWKVRDHLLRCGQ